MQGRPRPDLVTRVLSLSYDFCTREGTLFMPEYCCTDMTGAIRLFVAIDPEVERIFTRSGDVPDTYYVRADDDDHDGASHFDSGWWLAVRVSRPRRVR